MTRVHTRAACSIVASAIAASALVAAQSPTASARHVRSAPITVGRLVSVPVVDAPGAFAALRENSRTFEIVGVVQNHIGTPVPNAGTVVIRELLTGTIVGTSAVDVLAQFRLESIPAGIYTAELVNRGGAVIASTPAFTANAGEVIQLAQTIPAQPHGLAQIIRSATATALTAAATSGVIALSPGAPVTPGS